MNGPIRLEPPRDFLDRQIEPGAHVVYPGRGGDVVVLALVVATVMGDPGHGPSLRVQRRAQSAYVAGRPRRRFYGEDAARLVTVKHPERAVMVSGRGEAIPAAAWQ